jgi:hypothetical protein
MLLIAFDAWQLDTKDIRPHIPCYRLYDSCSRLDIIHALIAASSATSAVYRRQIAEVA